MTVPNAQTAPQYKRLGDFVLPSSKAELFPQNPNGPWVLEIGFGDGRFWTAGADCQANYLGVELSGVSVIKALSKLRRANIGNVVLARAQAEWLVQNVVPEKALTRVYVNFPCPWPKTKHEEHRLLNPAFLALLASRLEDGGEVWLTTDHPEYLAESCQNVKSTGLYELTEAEPPVAALQTKYALKWQAQGLGIFHVRFKKQKNPSEKFLTSEVFSMPHSQMRGELPKNPSSFEKTVYRHGPSTVVLLECYGVPEKFIFLVRIEEPDLTQEVLIAARQRNDKNAAEQAAKVVVGLESFGGPLITSGVKSAVGDVTAWLLGQGLKIEHESY